jgi:hypothetical protein
MIYNLISSIFCLLFPKLNAQIALFIMLTSQIPIYANFIYVSIRTKPLETEKFDKCTPNLNNVYFICINIIGH